MAQVLRESVYSGDGPGDRGTSVQPGGHAAIREPCTIADARPVDVRTPHRAVCADDHFHHDREAVLAWIQRCQIGGELFRQHRKNPGRRVHRGGVVTGVRVDGRAVFHERVHIGDGHLNRDGIVRQEMARCC